MASFNSGLPKLENIEQIKSYLYRLNEQLTYMFGNLDPDENYSDYALNIYKSDGERVLEIAAGLKEVKAEMIKDGEIIAAINMSEEQIRILASKIKLEGTVTANNNFIIYEDGSIEARNAKFTGTIFATSGRIGGFEIEGNVLNATNFDNVQIDFGSVIIDETGIITDNFFIGNEEIWTLDGLIADERGNLYVNNSSHYNGWKLGKALDDLYSRAESGGGCGDCGDCDDEDACDKYDESCGEIPLEDDIGGCG